MAHTGTFYGLDCSDVSDRIFNLVSNQVFQFAKTLSVVTINVFQVTFSGDILRYFLDSNGGTPSLLDQVIAQTHATIYTTMFAVVVLIAAIVMLWRFLFGRLPASTFWGKFIQMALVAAFATFISVGANFSGALNWLNDQTVTISSTMISAFSSADCVGGPSGRAAAEAQVQAQSGTDSLREKAVVCAGDALYRATVFSPWVIGEVGVYDENLGQRILHQQGYSFKDIANNKNNGNLYTKGGGAGTGLSSFQDKYNDRDAMITDVFGVDQSQRNGTVSYANIKPTKQAGYWLFYSGGSPTGRFLIALFALFASVMVSIIILAISVSYLLLEISSIMFAMLALPAALFGLIPGFGMRVFLRWLELLLGSFAKRIVLGLFAGLVVGLYQALLNVNGVPWSVKIIFITLIAGFGLLYRKRFAEAFTFNFSGSQSFYEHGEASHRIFRGYMSQVEKFAQKGDQVEQMAKTAGTAGMGGVGAAGAAGGAAAGGSGGSSQTGDRIRSLGNFLPGLLRAGEDDTKKPGAHIPLPQSDGLPPQPTATDSGSSGASMDRLAAKAERAASALDGAASSSRGVSAGSHRTSNVVYVPPPHQPANPPASGAAPTPEPAGTRGVPTRDRR